MYPRGLRVRRGDAQPQAALGEEVLYHLHRRQRQRQVVDEQTARRPRVLGRTDVAVIFGVVLLRRTGRDRVCPCGWAASCVWLSVPPAPYSASCTVAIRPSTQNALPATRCFERFLHRRHRDEPVLSRPAVLVQQHHRVLRGTLKVALAHRPTTKTTRAEEEREREGKRHLSDSAVVFGERSAISKRRSRTGERTANSGLPLPHPPKSKDTGKKKRTHRQPVLAWV